MYEDCLFMNIASCWMGCYPSWHSDCAQYLYVFLLLLHEFSVLYQRKGEATDCQVTAWCGDWCHYCHWNVSIKFLYTSNTQSAGTPSLSSWDRHRACTIATMCLRGTPLWYGTTSSVSCQLSPHRFPRFVTPARNDVWTWLLHWKIGLQLG